MSGVTTDGIDVRAARESLDRERIGAEIHERIRALYPICRSITGNGVRETLGLIGREIELRTEEIPTGTSVFDWTIPKEWNIRDAWIKDSTGRRVVDFQESNLHVVGYSIPVHRRMPLSELRPHLHTIPQHPEWIPYKTSYYAENWGFCLTDRQLASMRDGKYEVCIDSTLERGHLTLGECVLPGRERGEVLISVHVCHPSLCNDNLSGVSIAVSLARLLATVTRRYTYRFVFVPGTIGAIAWLARHEEVAARIRHGLVLACAGDRGPLTFKRSRRGTSVLDRAVAHVLQSSGEPFEIEDFSPYGYDERQYCSPGFNLPVGVLSRTPHGRFDEYHTSADDPDFVTPAALAHTLDACLQVIAILEGDTVCINRNPKCEPQLGRRGLYGSMGGHGGTRQYEQALLWVLNFSDGTHSLLDIAERSGIPFRVLRESADRLIDHDLLDEVRLEG